ncbi:MAG: ABC transporter permease [Clostridia bacterium]|nr:ABC transporter permease [Clostridia bacterium]
MNNTMETLNDKFRSYTARKRNSFKMNANIVRELVKKNVKVQYRNSIIGALWTVLNPLLNMLVMWFVFSTFFGTGDEWYALYILCGNIIFSFMRGATVQSLPSIVYNRGLLTKNKISQFVFPVSCNLGAVVNFAFSSVALVGVMVVTSIANHESAFGPSLFLVVLMLPALFLFSYGLSLILTAMYVFFRDVQHFYNVFLTLWTYLTPLFWKKNAILEKAKAQDGTEGFLYHALEFVINANPMYHFVDYFREITYSATVNGWSLDFYGFPKLGILYLIGLAFFGIGTLVFSLTRKNFIYNI